MVVYCAGKPIENAVYYLNNVPREHNSFLFLSYVLKFVLLFRVLVYVVRMEHWYVCDDLFILAITTFCDRPHDYKAENISS